MTAFDELEIELAEGDEKDLRKLERALRDAGRDRRAGHVEARPALGRGRRGAAERPTARRPGCSPRHCGRSATSCVRRDPGTRTGLDPEDLHQFRVATRRLRAFLRTGSDAARPRVGRRAASRAEVDRRAARRRPRPGRADRAVPRRGRGAGGGRRGRAAAAVRRARRRARGGAARAPRRARERPLPRRCSTGSMREPPLVVGADTTLEADLAARAPPRTQGGRAARRPAARRPAARGADPREARTLRGRARRCRSSGRRASPTSRRRRSSRTSSARTRTRSSARRCCAGWPRRAWRRARDGPARRPRAGPPRSGARSLAAVVGAPRRTREGARGVSLVLVRHAPAGDRSEWDGDDRLRPLDKKGREAGGAAARRCSTGVAIGGASSSSPSCAASRRSSRSPRRAGSRSRRSPELGERQWRRRPGVLAALLGATTPSPASTAGSRRALGFEQRFRKGAVWLFEDALERPSLV